ncbi:MAG: aminotransferase class V-fold PLP-dependent enzyme, partial [Clostridia bacterium]|nr:aminotransferase class V-fold PLP-dependent enzyme [Clostridia bacterium]
MSNRRIYMDNAATTATRPEVVEAMMPYFTQFYGNASSIHSFGRDARRALENARRQVASALNCEPREIYFTAGGSESDNWAIRCALQSRPGKHIITSAIEHHAVLHTCEYMEKQGYEVTYLPVDEYGIVSVEEVQKAIRPDTVLITIMAANNEIGTIEPIAELAAIARAHGVLFHTDAVQAIGHMPIDVREMNIDMLSMS